MPLFALHCFRCQKQNNEINRDTCPQRFYNPVGDKQETKQIKKMDSMLDSDELHREVKQRKGKDQLQWEANGKHDMQIKMGGESKRTRSYMNYMS